MSSWIRNSIAAVVCLSLGAVSIIAVTEPSAAENEDTENGFDSPAMAALAKKLSVGDDAAKRATIDDFLQELDGKAPLIESTADDPHTSWITFLWRGDDSTRRMNVQGGPATGDFAPKM